MRAITVATVSGLLAASFCVAYAVRPAALVAARAPVTHAVFVAPEALTAVVQKRCAECHNDDKRRGELSLETFDVAAAAKSPALSENCPPRWNGWWTPRQWRTRIRDPAASSG